MDNEMVSAEEFFGESQEDYPKKGLSEMLEWRLKEAKAGDAVQQLIMGTHYLNEGNERSARKWLERAAAQGKTLAKELLEELDAEA